MGAGRKELPNDVTHLKGIRLLDGPVTAASLIYRNNYIDICSLCWSPKDNSREFDGLGQLNFRALMYGKEKGHGGKGNIFIWASGNGGLANDHCGADGYVNSIYTVATGAVTKLGLWTFN
nr:PREDICTED: proprotein convertase subtilisin/kexin type 6-like [Lepisosteus oculatus]